MEKGASMDDDDAEDVLLANSPLHQHLQEAGWEHVQCECSKNGDKGEIDARTSSTAEVKHTRRVHPFTSIIIWLSGFLGTQAVKDELTCIRDFYKQELLRKCLRSNLLTEEDKDSLEGILDDCHVPSNEGRVAAKFRRQKIMLFTAPCVTAYFYSRMYRHNTDWTYIIYPDILAALASIPILIFPCTHLISMWRKMQEENILKKILEYVKIGEKLMAQVKKSLILIQEAELVARGFTLTSHRNPVLHLEQSSAFHSQRQCPKLRQSVFFVSRLCMLQYKDATTNLLTKYPLERDSDGTQCYLAYIPLDEYGECLSIDGDSPGSLQDLAKVTDGFSIAALKSLSQLCILQQSEFFSRLILTLVELEQQRNFSLLSHMRELFDTITSQQEQLYRVHNHHKNLVTLRGEKGAKPKYTGHCVRTGLQDLHVAVHSLDLHLQAALLRVRSLTDILEMEIEKQKNNHKDISESDQSQESLLQQISQELSACKGCWEEGISRLEKLQKKAQPGKPQAMEPRKEGSTEGSDGGNQIKIVEIKDPIIEDEVFEAYIDEDEEFDTDSTWDEYLTPEEKAKKKQEKAEAMRVLSELKSVIHIRAVEMDRREKIALEKCHGKDKAGDSFFEKVGDEANVIKGSDVEKQSDANHLTSVDGAVELKSQNKPCLQLEKTDANKIITGQIEQFDDKVALKHITEQEIDQQENNFILEDSTKSAQMSTNYRDNNVICEEETGVDEGGRILSNSHCVQPGVRFKGLPQSGLAFTASLAAQAVAVSHNMGLSQDTFGDSESSEGESQDCECED